MAKYQDWLKEENLILIEGWARNGLSDKQIAHNMGIAYSTFREWKDKYPVFSATLKKSKEVVDLMVENALFKRAIGYDYDEVTEEYSPKDGKKTKKVKKHVAGDTTAQIFWLKNRKPEDWRDKPQNTIKDEYEDDGLIKALSESISDEDMIDDSDFLPEVENE